MTQVVKKQFTTALIAVIAIIGTSCIKDRSDLPAPGNNLDVFTFTTKATYTLNVEYDVPRGYNVYFEAYSENPIVYNEQGQETLKAGLQPLDKGYTDANGAYSFPTTIPAHVEKLYIYSPNAGVPALMVAKVENGRLGAAVPATMLRESASVLKDSRSSNDNPDLVDKTNFPIPTKTLGKWMHYVDGYASFPHLPQSIMFDKKARIWGRPTYLKSEDKQFFPSSTLANPMVVDATIWNTINSTLPGKDVPQSELQEILKQGDIHVTKASAIDLNLLDSRGAYMNVLAYYCYKTATPPQSVSDIKTQAIAIPNTYILKDHSFPYAGSGAYAYGAMRGGEGIALHYFDENGVDQGTTFPAGVSIGWILYGNGYSYHAGTVSTGTDGTIYSNPALDSGMQHVALFRHGQTIILSFEDGKKTSVNDIRDYDDVLFAVTSSEPDAITDGIPDKDPEAPKEDEIVAVVTHRGILTFEDIWPYRGDFDMNDVVIKYESTIGYNISNKVLQTIEKFTPISSGAKLNNSFAYQNPNISGSATVTIEGGDGNGTVDATDKSIIRLANKVLDYANSPVKKTFTVTTKYATPISKDTFVMPPYNPFITVSGDTGHEVHLTNQQPTSFADMKLLGTGHDKSQPAKGIYYVTYNEQNEQMPFAIDMMFENDETLNGFVIPAETKCINLYYTGFMGWILSGGKTNQDWYLHPKK